MSARDLLIEIGTEELPPKALNKLAQAFAGGVKNGCTEARIKFGQVQVYATPRRLAVLLTEVEELQADSHIEKRGPAIKAAFDENAQPSKAAQGFARGCGVKLEDLQTLKTDKGEWLVFRSQQKGKASSVLLADIVNKSLQKLPIPRRMRWADGSVEFVRPVHWIVLLFGTEIIHTNILGVDSGRDSRGHRFHHPQAITLQSPADYVQRLENPGYVLVDADARQASIRKQTMQAAEKLGGCALIDDDLLQEVTALVEWPVALAGDFDKEFLAVPPESLISAMQGHQKYFPVVDKDNNLLAHFITICNIDSKDMAKVKAGNERVIRPRLGDAKFFWEQDGRKKLASHIDSLDKVVFQAKLGSLGDKSRRVANIAQALARQLQENTAYAKRAGLLSKCDLMTDMVHEFPDLQGIMGRYYAANDGEANEVAIALDEQYMPRFAGDSLPTTKTGQILSVADKVDTLLAIFAIGQKPTGEKDPFALRRAALGVLRILIECNLPVDLKQLLTIAADVLQQTVDAREAMDEVLEFMLQRLRVYYTSKNIALDTYDAVASLKPTQPVDFDRRITAVNDFRALPEAESLAAANKRTRNILKKITGDRPQSVDVSLFQEPAETSLNKRLLALSEKVNPLFERGDYKAALQELACLREPVDNFFDNVMVMADDKALQNNRLALLNRLSELFLRVADLSRLQS
jgi:glycyl-tRNA synthetase beta chain